MINRGVRYKLLLLVAISVVAFCLLGAYGSWTAENTFQSINEVRETAVEFRDGAEQITEPLNELRQLSLTMVMAPDKRLREDLNAKQSAKTTEIEDTLASWINTNASAEESEAFETLRQRWADYVKMKDLTVAKVLADYREEAFINAIQAEEDQFSMVKEALTGWMAAKVAKADQAFLEAQDQYSGARSLYLAVIVILTVLVASLGYLIARSIIGPIERMREIASRIAEGASRGSFDVLEQRIGLKADDELGALATAFNQMIETMQLTLQRLSDAERRTQAVLNSTVDGIVTVDEDGNFKNLNTSAERLLGCRASEVVGTNVTNFVPALQRSNGRFHSSVKALGQESEVIARTQDGRECPIALRVSELSFSGENLVIATLQDIAERKRAEVERQNLFGAIRDAVKRLSVASQEILASTSEQAAGTQQQAASVSQTVSTVNEIAQTARQAADRSNEVAESARHADDIGNAGRAAIEESISAMQQVQRQVESLAKNILSLAERAQAIGEITSTVNDIAEQTNVLALNAAVEASRAGEHGKGFAVVASEVKSLAQQSKSATNQVRKILSEIQKATNDAVHATEDGHKTVLAAADVIEKAGETINLLTDTLTVSARSAAQISASANQQATGVSQLNQGMTNINHVTRRNVESIRQIEASAQNLNELSQELASLTS